MKERNMDELSVLLISADPQNATGGIATWTKGYMDYCRNNNINCELVDTAKISKYRHNKILNEIARTKAIINSLNTKIESCPHHFDLAHLNSSIGFYGIIRDYFLARSIVKKNIPLVLHFHCDIAYWDRGLIKRHFISKILRLASKCIVLCGSSKKHLLNEYGVHSDILPNFFDIKNIHVNKTINDKANVVVYTGRVSKAKGSIEILQLASRFPDKTFIMAGKRYLNIEEYDVPSNVKLLGEKKHQEILDILCKADVFLFPSHSEGFSIALLEAMAEGLPSIVTDVGANRDMVSNGAGIVVSLGSISEMEDALRRLEPRSIRLEMSNAAYHKVINEYSVEQVMNQLFYFYSDLLVN